MADFWNQLSAPFPGSSVRWRIGRKSKKGDKAMPLAYIDARDVMDRLDAVVGPANWQTTITETARGRVLCGLSIRVDAEWVTKSDGAGETQVEGEKGAISDAIKRSAVHWGIGRYLYSMEAPWMEINQYGQFTDQSMNRLAKIAGRHAPKTISEPEPSSVDTVRALTPELGKLERYDADRIQDILSLSDFGLRDVQDFRKAKDLPPLRELPVDHLNRTIEWFLSPKGREALTNFRS
jgi:hypothetical protein